MKLSTVIVNYNTRDKLARALESLLAAGGVPSHEIIVVDNASADGSAAMVRERFPSVRLIESGENRWFSGGNNLGFRAAQGEYVHILNPDTAVLPGALPAMIAALDTDPSLGAVTSRMTYDDGTLQRNCSRRVTYADLVLGYTFIGALLPGWRDRRRARMWYAEWDRESDWDVEIAPGSNTGQLTATITKTMGTAEKTAKSGQSTKPAGYAVVEGVIGGVKAKEKDLVASVGKVIEAAVKEAQKGAAKVKAELDKAVKPAAPGAPPASAPKPDPVLSSNLDLTRAGPGTIAPASSGVTVNITNATVREEADLSRIGSQVAYMVMARG